MGCFPEICFLNIGENIRMRVRGRGDSCILVLGILFWINFFGQGGDDEMNDFFLRPACLSCDRSVLIGIGIGILYCISMVDILFLP